MPRSWSTRTRAAGRPRDRKGGGLVGLRHDGVRSVLAGVAGCVLACLVVAAPLQAQDRQLSLEVEALGGGFGYARAVGPSTWAGVEVGAALPRLGVRLHPDGVGDEDADFEEYLHLAVFARWRASPVLELDAGVRGSWASLWPCGASDCYPSPFWGGYLQPMIGGERWKIGVRLNAGWIAESRANSSGQTFLVSLLPLVGRIYLPR